MKNNNELVSLLQHGSWYQVAFMVDNHLESFTTQGIKKTREAIDYYGVKHTAGVAIGVSSGIEVSDLSIFFKKAIDK